MFEKKMEKRAQVWVETVIYTLIALALMGLILAFAKPKIDSVKDQLLIEQTIESMNKINDQIYDVQIAPGNKRILTVKITKGKLTIDPDSSTLNWVLESKYKYSELARPVRLGSLTILTEAGKPYTISVSANYSADFTLNNATAPFTYEASPTPYNLVILNKGNSGGNLIIDLAVD